MTSLFRPALVLALALGTACNSHLPVSPDDGPQILENGISVPVPPPSLQAAPLQAVDIDGELGADVVDGTQVFLRDAVQGDPGYFILAEPDGTFHFKGVILDLSDNCIEIWSEEPGPEGAQSMTSFYHAVIAEDDQSVIAEQFFSGC
jgi:hypothetical protein